MSSQLVWELLKKNTCFLKKGLQGEVWTTEPGNLYAKHSYKYSGLANDKVVDVTAGEGTALKVTKSRPKAANKPASFKTTAVSKKRFARQLKSIAKEVGNVRPDLKDAALRKASAVHRSQVKAAAKKSA